MASVTLMSFCRDGNDRKRPQKQNADNAPYRAYSASAKRRYCGDDINACPKTISCGEPRRAALSREMAPTAHSYILREAEVSESNVAMRENTTIAIRPAIMTMAAWRAASIA